MMRKDGRDELRANGDVTFADENRVGRFQG